MSTFIHDDLLDPGANWCPVCGEMRGICQCTDEEILGYVSQDWDEDDWNRWAYDQLYGWEEPNTYYNYSYDMLDNFYGDDDDDY